MTEFRKKPLVVEAIQWTGPETCVAVFEFLGWTHPTEDGECSEEEIFIPTQEGTMTATRGDWIIREPFPTGDRMFYPCKPDIFEQTYEPVGP